MDHHSAGAFFGPLVLLGAAVISVPIARFARLSAIVAYLLAGIVIGPFGVGIFSTPETILTVAELGVVMLLFLIGLELELSRLLAMRRDIFGLGVAQLLLTGAAIAGLAFLTGRFGWQGALVAGLSLALSATSIALRILEERGHLQQQYGQRAFAILLLQDMAVVPLLALVPLMATSAEARQQLSLAETAGNVALAGAAIAALVIAGPLPAQSVLPHAGVDRRARGDDRGRAAGRARRGRPDAVRRHVDGAWRVPRRRAARGIDLSPRAGSRHRAVPRPAAGAVLHGRRHDDRHEDRVGEPVAGARRRCRDHRC